MSYHIETEMDKLNSIPGSLQPKLEPGVYAFVSLPENGVPQNIEPLATFREREGISLIVSEQDAEVLGCPILFRASWISLGTQTDLNAIGITAAIASALSTKNISCNVVAGALHDHLFVPVDRATEALECIRFL